MPLKLDPIAYVLLVAILGVQVYVSFLRSTGSEAFVEDNDALYRRAVFEDPSDKGVMHQIFRQNEVDREMLKAILVRCAE